MSREEYDVRRNEMVADGTRCWCGVRQSETRKALDVLLAKGYEADAPQVIRLNQHLAMGCK